MARFGWCMAGALLLATTAQAQDKFAVKPEAPTAVQKTMPDGTSVPGVTGTYALRVDADGNPVIADRGYVTGGACLVYRRARGTQHCEEASDCKLRPAHPAGTTPFAYCVPPQPGELGIEGNSNKKVCWYKDEAADGGGCRKEPFTPLVVDATMEIPATPAKPLGPTTPLYWRIVTCQNLTIIDNKPGCAGGQEGIDSRLRYSDVKEL